LLVIDIVDGKIYTANPKLGELLGYSMEKLLTLTVFNLHPKEFLSRSSEVIADVWEKKGLIYTDIPFITSSGEILPVECSAKVISFSGRPAILIYARDIRERLRMEKDIRDKNEIIAQKNKDITDSIHYAKRIQHALLASEELLDKNLKGTGDKTSESFAKDYFILFKPKDIVSGDFYWATVVKEIDEKSKETLPHSDSFRHRFYLAVCDSTGHGVPGAFMSLLNISFLNEAITEKGIRKPNEVFNHVRQRLIENISSEGAQDGMDGILLCLSPVLSKGEGVRIEYAAAHNAPVLIQNGKIIELNADKMPVGAGEKTDSFKLETLNIEHGILYLYTDGYADQFGGPRRKKFMYKQFASLLLSIQDKSMDEQKRFLDKTIEEWKGGLEQIDDILVIGLKI